MWREARGEGDEGLRAVGHVVVNRANHWYAEFKDPIHHAIFAPAQFPSMSNPSDPNYRRFPADVDPQWQYARGKALEIVNGEDEDNTRGALYYANLADIDPNGWFMRNVVNQSHLHPLLVVIAHQSFYA
jgi:spore germination cell wall hydrolase CwlJ-like protein